MNGVDLQVIVDVELIACPSPFRIKKSGRGEQVVDL
jgi:hypothetical protein